MERNERLSIGYNAALQRTDAESSLIWGTFNALVTANSIVIGVYIAMPLSGTGFNFSSSTISAFGIALCIVWYLMLNRQFAYYNYWFSWARTLEKAILAPDVRMIADGEQYGQGKEVEIPGEAPLQMNPMAGRVKIQALAKCVIGLFAVAYILLLGSSAWSAISN